jgi:flavin reductase (DIM6/NTAB) family NADH-FMN oxidoreductase RutF
MHLTRSDIKAMSKVDRLHLINSLSGIKPANLIGTVDKEGNENLAVFSSVVHLGSNPALFGFILRPKGEVRRHTHENIIATNAYTISFVHTGVTQQAHFTSIKAEKDQSEFDLSGFTPQYIDGFSAPFVQESTVKMGLSFVEEIPIKANNTSLMIGQVEHVILPDNVKDQDFMLNLEELNVAGISGLNTYYKLQKTAFYPYVRDHFDMDDLIIE